MTTPTNLMLISKHSAPKTGLHSTGSVVYAILRDADATEVFIAILANKGGTGYFSPEPTPLTRIEQCLSGIAKDKTIPAKVFKGATLSRSANQPGFITAALRHAGLLRPAPDASHQHVLGEDWQKWKAAQLALPAVPFESPGAKPAPVSAEAVAATDIVPDETAAGRKVRSARKEKDGRREHPTGGTNEVAHADPE